MCICIKVVCQTKHTRKQARYTLVGRGGEGGTKGLNADWLSLRKTPSCLNQHHDEESNDLFAKKRVNI